MDIMELQTLIANMGFPIACVCALAAMLYKEHENHREDSERWMNIVEKNTKAITELTAIIKDRGGNNGN